MNFLHYHDRIYVGRICPFFDMKMFSLEMTATECFMLLYASQLCHEEDWITACMLGV